MKKDFYKIYIFALSLVLLCSFAFPNHIVNANTNDGVHDTPNELGKRMKKDISELSEEEAAEELVYIINNIFVYDSKGEVIGVNESKSIERYGYVPEEIKEVEANIASQKEIEKQGTTGFRSFNYSNYSDCITGEVRKSFATAIPASTIAAIAEDASSGTLTKGTVVKVLKQAGKSAIKGNIYGIAAQIMVSDAQCSYHYTKVGQALGG